MSAAHLLSTLDRERLLAIVRGTDAQAALDTVLTLFRSGVEIIEVSLTSTDALSVIEKARTELGPGALLGAGTLLTAGDAHAAASAGACFGVTPGVGDAVSACRALGLPVLAGAVTPTEVIAALGEGATAVKLFPASIGGPAYLRALRDPFPEVAFVPVGGVDAEAARAHLAAGALAVGVGGPLVGDAARGGSLDALAGRAARFREVTRR
ncbi:bifunctional 4-hydroxy-2-oxoglutarate aldolase/2-dehydro-3-deoxy-phosphogluconate aldolase [Streptomyces sp. L2]|uniref:bifunctional 4-hydroxy-2-oxoglutarate aldolase/2-dehydro-3-deoxy-phosphogluconate aldolase n=1 Tax=Streptomyces sp. L2 TaxID=2162665 RepID=UPI00101192CF|nr:bifunctional 4-hydroxy-2-oxoglutarate aldolase/2-dehydro-3-deoxy-phosphogluconate aldolase [Streptomyces sp. L2]